MTFPSTCSHPSGTRGPCRRIVVVSYLTSLGTRTRLLQARLDEAGGLSQSPRRRHHNQTITGSELFSRFLCLVQLARGHNRLLRGMFGAAHVALSLNLVTGFIYITTGLERVLESFLFKVDFGDIVICGGRSLRRWSWRGLGKERYIWGEEWTLVGCVRRRGEEKII